MVRLPCLLLVFSTLVAAQQPARSKPIHVHLPSSVPPKSVNIVYLLEGPFGGHSSQVQPREDKLSYTLPMTTEELTATRMKAVIWTEGCELQTFELDLLHSAGRELTFACLAPSSVLLTGRLLLSDALRKEPHQLAISYGVSWICGFFGSFDCKVPLSRVATLTPADDETFTVQLPDFSRVPQSGARAMVSDGSFYSYLLDSKMNPRNGIQPELEDVSAPDGSLKVLPTYPSNLAFLPGYTLR